MSVVAYEAVGVAIDGVPAYGRFPPTDDEVEALLRTPVGEGESRDSNSKEISRFASGRRG